MSDYEDFMFVDADDEFIYEQNTEAKRVLNRIELEKTACVKNRNLKRKRDDEKESEKKKEKEKINQISSEKCLKLEIQVSKLKSELKSLETKFENASKKSNLDLNAEEEALMLEIDTYLAD